MERFKDTGGRPGPSYPTMAGPTSGPASQNPTHSEQEWTIVSNRSKRPHTRGERAVVSSLQSSKPQADRANEGIPVSEHSVIVNFSVRSVSNSAADPSRLFRSVRPGHQTSGAISEGPKPQRR